MKLRIQTILASALMLVITLALAGCGKEAPPKAEDSGPKVNGDEVQFAVGSPQLDSITVDTARPRTVAIHHLTGRLYWDDDVTVRIFTPVAGRVTRVVADIGQVATNGTPLAEIDSPDFGQALSAARTAVANLVAADKTFVRAKDMIAHGAAAQKDVEAAEAAYVAALAERDRAEAVLANYGGSDQSSNEVYVLRTPLAGVVVDKSVNPGQELRADMMLGNVPQVFNSLFTVSDPTKLWLQLDVPEADLSALAPGQKLMVHSEAFPGKLFAGTVDKIGDALDPATRTVKVRGLVTNPDRLLKAEMYVTVDVAEVTGETAAAAVEIPASSVFMLDDDYFLFIEMAPGRFKRQQVEVGAESDGKIPVFAGVNAGQRIVTEGALLLQSIVNPAD